MTPDAIDRPILHFTHPSIISVSPDDDLDDACREMQTADVSAVLVIGRDGDPAGVLSRRDLLEVGRVMARGHHGVHPLELPPRAVGDLMSHPVVTVDASATVAEAAAAMLERRIHRVFVLDHGKPVGVFSTREAMEVARVAGIRAPLSTIASTRVHSIDRAAQLSQAVTALEESGKAGVVVTDDGLPIGVFAEADAIAARDLDYDAPIEELIDHSLLLLPATTPVFRAAAFAVATRARRIVIVDDRHHARGLVSGLDFCRALVGGPPRERGVASGGAG